MASTTLASAPGRDNPWCPNATLRGSNCCTKVAAAISGEDGRVGRRRVAPDTGLPLLSGPDGFPVPRGPAGGVLCDLSDVLTTG